MNIRKILKATSTRWGIRSIMSLWLLFSVIGNLAVLPSSALAENPEFWQERADNGIDPLTPGCAVAYIESMCVWETEFQKVELDRCLFDMEGNPAVAEFAYIPNACMPTSLPVIIPCKDVCNSEDAHCEIVNTFNCPGVQAPPGLLSSARCVCD